MYSGQKTASDVFVTKYLIGFDSILKVSLGCALVFDSKFEPFGFEFEFEIEFE